MKKQKGIYQGIVAGCCLMVIILDGKTSITAMGDGIELCIRTVIPSLFPFFILSPILGNCLLGLRSKPLAIVHRLCKIPRGCESILIVSFLSGYPVGAQLVAQAYQAGVISKQSARRMLGFCSNAGPSFLFGMLLPLFAQKWILWVLWAVHIVSALLVGWLLPEEDIGESIILNNNSVSITQVMRKAMENIAYVCGWIVTFRVIIDFCGRWFMWRFPTELQVLLSGLLELSNGCILLNNIQVSGMRFILVGVMLSFGGFCVMMQTASVTKSVGLGLYFPGKLLQTLLTAIICGILQVYIFPKEHIVTLSIPVIILLLGITLLTVINLRRKKVVAFQKKMLYNTVN